MGKAAGASTDATTLGGPRNAIRHVQTEITVEISAEADPGLVRHKGAITGPQQYAGLTHYAGLEPLLTIQPGWTVLRS